MLFRSFPSHDNYAKTVVSTDLTGLVYKNTYTFDFYCTEPTTVTITGTDLKLEDIKRVKFTLDSEPIYIEIVQIDDWEKVDVGKNKIVIKTKKGYYYKTSRKIQVSQGTSVTLKGTSENIAQGTVAKAYTSSFPLTEIDDLREYILSKGRQEILINKESDEKLKSLFIYNVLFSPNPEKDETPESISYLS